MTLKCNHGRSVGWNTVVDDSRWGEVKDNSTFKSMECQTLRKKISQFEYYVTRSLTAAFSREGLVVRRKTDDFPLVECHRSDIDLLFIADAGTATPKTLGFDHYIKQMRFFSQLLDVFLSAGEDRLTRLKVAVIASTIGGSYPYYKPRMNMRVDFNQFTDKSSLQSFLLADNVEAVPVSFPISAALYAMQDLFNDAALGSRPDAQHVLIMVVNGAKPLQINPNDDLKAFNSTSVKMLVLLVGSESGVHIMSIFPSNNLVEVTSFDDMMQNQMIPIMLCLQCYNDWFRYKANNDEESIPNISCYRLFYSHQEINWVQAGEQCLAAESELVSIETKEELSFLRESLPTKIHELSNFTGDSNDSVDIFIGLKRDTGSYGQRFRWINDLPLAYTAWNVGEPLGGHIQGCAVWNFNVSLYSQGVDKDIISSALKDIQNRSEYQSATDGWYSIGCGYRNAKYYMCESKKPPSFREGKMPNLTKASENKVLAAVSRGELGLATTYSETFGYMSSLVATSSIAHSDDKPMLFTVLVNHSYSSRLPSTELLLFPCEDAANTKVPYAQVCDHVAQCQNKRDELICNYRKCDTMNEFTCSSGQCVPLDAQCDLFPDCVDQSDEDKCIKCRNGLCHDGRCLPKHWFADGEVDCNACTSRGDLKAEMQSVPDMNIANCVFTCNRTQCTYESMLGDGIIDCTGPEGPLDETLGSLESSTCYLPIDNETTLFNNWAPRCVYYKDRYDGLLGCRDLIHLQNCDQYTCSEGYIKCPNSYCIPIHYVANGVYDCPNGEDEMAPLDCTGNFQCYSSKICLHPDNVCDGHPHCPQGDDEINCHVTCSPGFVCLAGVVVVKDFDLSIPLTDLSFIDPRTRYLDLSGVNISTVFPEFPKGHFYNLLEMYLSHCGITHVDAVTYSQNDMWSVIEADLSSNEITGIGVTSIFRYMVSLKSLNLSMNLGLSYLHPDTFNTYGTTSQLTLLDLSYTSIASLHFTLLMPLVNLEVLILRGTKIVDMVPGMFPEDFVLQVLDIRQIDIQHVYAETFKYLTVKSNMYTDSFKLCCPQLHSEKTPRYVCDSPPDPFSSCSDLMEEPILRVLLWVFGFLAVTGNVLVIVYRLTYDRNILKMAYGHFVMHLSVSDMFMGLYLLIVASADTYYRGSYVWNEMEWRNSVACKAAGFLSTMSSEVSTFYIFLITVDRFLVIRFPFGQLKMSGPLILVCCVLAWVCGVTIALIPFLPPFKHWTTYCSNGLCLALPLFTRRLAGWEFSSIVFIFLNLFLFIIIAVGQFIIYRTMSKMRMGHGAVSNTNNRRVQDYAVAKHLSIIAITNFFCWFPIGVMGLLALAGYNLGIQAYAWSAVMIMPMNSAINPFIYTIPALMQRWSEFIFKISRDDSSRANTQ